MRRLSAYKETALEDETRTKAERVDRGLGINIIRRDIAKSADPTMLARWCERLVSYKMHHYHSESDTDTDPAIFAVVSTLCFVASYIPNQFARDE